MAILLCLTLLAFIVQAIPRGSLPRGRASEGYDERGQLVEQTDARGVQTGWTYDERGLPEGVSFPGGSVTYGYDDAGRRTSMTDATGTTSWTFDDAGRVTAAAAPAGTIGYAHDDAGRRTSMTLPGGREIGYGYDLAGRLTSMVDPSQDEIAFGYDEDGRRTTIERPNGVDTTTTYDDAGRVTSIAHAGAGGTVASFSYGYDDAGRRTSVTTAAGTETYVHDDLGQLISVTYADGEDVSYTYDDAGNRLTETRDDVTTTYTYDDASRLTQVGTTAYTYDDAGNLIGAGADEFTYDYGNRLLTASVGAHDATYTYDGDGVRVGTDVDTVSHDLLVDRDSGLPTVVDDGDAAYLHADGLIEASGTSSSFPLLDALGSVRSITSSAGAVTATSSYDAFGTIRAQTGTPMGFGFTGEPTDATDLVYLRARTLDPATARFLQSDSVRPGGPGTVGYNLYAYATNDPATWTDPTGHFQQSLFGMGSIVLAWELITGESAGLLATLAAYPVVLGIVIIFVVAFAIIACNLIDACHEFFVHTQGDLEGGSAGDILQPIEGDPSDAPTTHPGTPVPPIPPGGGGGTAECDDQGGLPDRVARVVQQEYAGSSTLGSPGASDVFVAAAEDIAGITSSELLAQALSLIDPAGNLIRGPFAVIEFDTPEGIACPINRDDPGFEPGGQTGGGVREFTVPNYKIGELSNVVSRVVP